MIRLIFLSLAFTATFAGFAQTTLPASEIDKRLESALNVIQLYNKDEGISDLSESEAYDSAASSFETVMRELEQLEKADIDWGSQTPNETFRKKCAFLLYLFELELGGVSYVFNISIAESHLNRAKMQRDKITAANFPIRIFLDETEYEWNASQLDVWDHDYNQQMADIRLLQNNNQEAAEYARKALAYSKIEPYTRVFMKLVLSRALSNMRSFTAEMAESRISAHEELYAVSTSDQKFWDSLNFVRPIHLYQDIDEALINNPSLAQGGEYYARAMRQLDKDKLLNEAMDFAERAMLQGKSDKAFFKEVIVLARKGKNSSLGLQATDKLRVLITPGNCAEMMEVSGNYAEFGNAAKAAELRTEAEACQQLAAQREKEQQRIQEEQRRKEEKRDRRNNSPAGIYFGVDLLPLARFNPDKRDYGFQMDLIGHRIAHEFYYEQINENRDYMFDLNDADEVDVLWNGTNVHYALKFMSRNSSSSQFFFGPAFRYREKEFMDITSDYSDENGIYVGVADFKPTEKQYEVLLNYGVMGTKNGFTGQFYFGMGVKYSEFSFDSGMPDGTMFTHPLLAQRKATRIGMGMRVGFTVGIKLF
jgi:hypothetical protein